MLEGQRMSEPFLTLKYSHAKYIQFRVQRVTRSILTFRLPTASVGLFSILSGTVSADWDFCKSENLANWPEDPRQLWHSRVWKCLVVSSQSPQYFLLILNVLLHPKTIGWYLAEALRHFIPSGSHNPPCFYKIYFLFIWFSFFLRIKKKLFSSLSPLTSINLCSIYRSLFLFCFVYLFVLFRIPV